MSRLKKSAAVGAAAIALVAAWEGLRTKAYFDAIKIPTVCFGETRGVKMGDQYTVQQCKDMLGTRLVEFEMGMRKCLKNPDAIPDGPYVAALSLSYNIGTGAFCRSSIRKFLDAGQIRQACDAFRLYTKAGGMRLQGLVNRREAERAICLKGLP
jgi:lysozyme